MNEYQFGALIAASPMLALSVVLAIGFFAQWMGWLE
ncbi:hypothetical protein GGR16_002633 [Chelatococcus caeni]|uniref:Uncharacterized protein n=1 Tax=Chelatococcus caeni TaxID=1348468 RepID=A0A840C272_9HYPH|nr:hypothetical protein [Chelatococcus caeni]